MAPFSFHFSLGFSFFLHPRLPQMLQFLQFRQLRLQSTASRPQNWLKSHGFSHSNWKVTRTGAPPATKRRSGGPKPCVCVFKTSHFALPLYSRPPLVAQIMVFCRSPSNLTDRSIVRLQRKYRFGTRQLCFGWRVGLAPYSTKVKHVHEKRFRGPQR